ncbi:MAG TPA: putative beta-lysine N-acetyltransferase [Desulfotomaculum sp.]|nr:putative beta-lysine N-acetyltransferase [Desulfotomaculum sp.]
MEINLQHPPECMTPTPAGCNVHNEDNVVFKDSEGNLLEAYIDVINKRLKVLHYRVQDWPQAVSWLDRAACEHQLGKILFNIKSPENYVLNNFGYIQEGVIPAFFRGADALCFSRFTDFERSQSQYQEQEEDILTQIKNTQHRSATKMLPAGLKLNRIDPDQAEDLVALYRQIFSSYPSPLLDPDYVFKVMTTHVCFWGVFKGDTIISAASAEMDLVNCNAEITDCATLPVYRGQGLLSHLISVLEKEMQARKIGPLYSLARAGSYGMNAALDRLGYAYRGRFINNCHIGGRFEDMNLWTKVV